MLNYIGKRLLALIPLFFGITLVCFFVIRLAPGSPVDMEESMNPKYSENARQKFIEMYDLDKPLPTQYALWLKKIIKLDFGVSFARDGRPVRDKILERIPVTISINIISLFFIFGAALFLGVLSAWLKGSAFDHAVTVFVFVGFAVPTFWLALLCMYLFGVVFGILPISGLTSWNYDSLSFFGKIADLTHHLILPVFISVVGGLAGMSRFMRGSTLDVLSKDYIMAARSHGLPEKTILFRHALKNALLPVVTLIGLSIPGLIGGSVIFESIFSIPGMGQLFYQSVTMRDYPTVMGILVIGAVLTLAGNLFADIMYALADPRIRYAGGEMRG
ncbi:MAG: ABC transporter permease [Deferribacteraceae bacterium]|jgi:peptide/nickel transport system permease protein|nr:ABC transporter permease [Deferribacteraceae bacterium]